MACFQNSCYSTHFFPVASVLFSSVFVLILQISLWFIFSAWLFTLRNAMAESKFQFVSDFPSPNLIILILCASREARITKKFSLTVRIYSSRGERSFQLFVVLPLFASVRYSRSLQENARGAFQIGHQVSLPESDLCQRWDRKFCRAFGRYDHVILIQAPVFQRYVQDCK